MLERAQEPVPGPELARVPAQVRVPAQELARLPAQAPELRERLRGLRFPGLPPASVVRSP